jgi:CRISPR/Cas system CMR-associated protein Cmr5 small subunit
MKNIEKMIPAALDAVPGCNIKNADGTVPKEMNGYISSFGASLISAGLLPTLIFFSQKGESKERNKVVAGLEFIIKKHYPTLLAQNDSLVKKMEEWIRKNDKPSLNKLADKLTEAAVALKLAIRTFPKSLNP